MKLSHIKYPFKAASAGQISEMFPHSKPYMLSPKVHHVYYLLDFSPCLIWEQRVDFFWKGYIYIYNTYKKESNLTWTANSSQETVPMEAYDTPLDLAYNVEQTRGMRFPKFLATLE